MPSGPTYASYDYNAAAAKNKKKAVARKIAKREKVRKKAWGKPVERSERATNMRLSRSRFKGTLFELDKKATARVRKLGSGGEGGVRSRTFFTSY
jgi:hypothetical protein